MAAPRVWIVPVNFNGLEDTRKCLRSLAALSSPASVVVVDNASNEDPTQILKQEFPSVHLIRNPVNAGWSGGNNAGIRFALARGADFVLLLNNDTTVAADLIAPILAAFDAQPRAGIAGPIVTYYDDPALVWSAGGTLRRTLGYTRHAGFRSRHAPDSNRHSDYVSGCAIAIRCEVFERVGELDERYFHYFEDVEICERARKLGYHSVTVAAASVRHKVSAAAGERGSNRLNRAQAYYFTRNRWLFVRRNMNGAQRWTALASQLGALFPYEMAKALLARNWPELRGRAEGIVDGLRGRDGARDVTP